MASTLTAVRSIPVCSKDSDKTSIIQGDLRHAVFGGDGNLAASRSYNGIYDQGEKNARQPAQIHHRSFLYDGNHYASYGKKTCEQFLKSC